MRSITIYYFSCIIFIQTPVFSRTYLMQPVIQLFPYSRRCIFPFNCLRAITFVEYSLSFAEKKDNKRE